MNYLINQVRDHRAGTGRPSSPWYAVYTHSRHEKTVKEYLDAKALEVFLPTVSSQSRWKDRTKLLQVPAFPGYVFVRIPLQERSKVLSAPGVVRILSFNGAPAPIDHAEIAALRLCLDQCGPLEPHPFMEVGERVRVRAGALQGLEGLVTRKKGACRLVLSIALIHRSVALEIDADLLETLPQTPEVDRPKERRSVDSDIDLSFNSLKLEASTIVQPVAG